jgi:hypothetical protein
MYVYSLYSRCLTFFLKKNHPHVPNVNTDASSSSKERPVWPRTTNEGSIDVHMSQFGQPILSACIFLIIVGSVCGRQYIINSQRADYEQILVGLGCASESVSYDDNTNDVNYNQCSFLHNCDPGDQQVLGFES